MNKEYKVSFSNLDKALNLVCNKQERIGVLLSESTRKSYIRRVDEVIAKTGHVLMHKEYFDLKAWSNMNYDLGFVFDNIARECDIVIIMSANGDCSIAMKDCYRYAILSGVKG